MKIKTADLIGPALDWAVAKCLQPGYEEWRLIRWIEQGFAPTANWSQGGPIIEREGIQLFVNRIIGTTESGIEVDERDGWTAYRTGRYWQAQPAFFGSTPLIAAMRCYVASKLGDEVEIPEELE